MKNYKHRVIRLKKGKTSLSSTKTKIHRIIVIINKKKSSSEKVLYKVGYFKYGKEMRMLSFNGRLLANLLNNGVELKQSVKRLFLPLAVKKKRKCV